MYANFDYKGFLFVIALIVVAVFSANLVKNSVETISQRFLDEDDLPVSLESIQKSIINNKEIRLGFVGDIMLDRGVKSKIMLFGGGSYDFPFQYASSTLRSYDILFGNLEGPISDKGANRGSIYSFRMDPKAVVALKNAGFDVLSVANNHIGDWGNIAMSDTFSHLRNAGIASLGGGLNKKEAHEPRILQSRGTKIAYLAYSQFGGGYTEAGDDFAGIAIIDEKSISQDVSYAKNLADIVIVSFHFGDEYKLEPNEFQKRISHLAIDAGADLVVGHHPHVIEQIEKYKEKTIAYSLGNFVFDQSFSKETMTGMILEVFVKNKLIERIATTKIVLNNNFQPQPVK